MRSLTVNEEVARLEAANGRLSRQLTELQKEVTELRSQPAAANESELRKLIEEVSRSNREQFSMMLNTRFEGIESRLLPEPRLRPPLACDRRAELNDNESSSKIAATEHAGRDDTALNCSPGSEDKGLKNKRRVKKPSMAAMEAAASRVGTPAPLLTPISSALTTLTPTGDSFRDVVTRKAKKGANRVASLTKPTEVPKAALPRKRKLQPPRTAAITLTLKPEAVKNGVKYESLLAKARNSIKLEDVGITELRFRTTVTGARMLELPPGTADADKAADALAEKLREVFADDMVHVQRPVKSAEIRVMGLDDSVTAEEVVKVVADEGSCTTTAIKSGVISRSQNGSGSLWLSCPITAAKKVVEAGRIKIGWISARVTLLESTSLRCFRCLEPGHVGAKCDRGVDRSSICYRCGKPGHKRRDCDAEPSCALCLAAGKPANHPIGAKACQGASARNIRKGDTKKTSDPVATPPSQLFATEDTMDTAQ